MAASCLSLLLSLFMLPHLQCRATAAKKAFVVYMGEHAHSPDGSSDQHEEVRRMHYEFLGSYLGSEEKARDAIFYCYGVSINGFAAMLEDEDANAIAKHPSVLSVFPNKMRTMHTTRSWEFLRVERDHRIPVKSIWTAARLGGDTIIANLDTGAWPDSASFNDDGIGPVPSKWKGICEKDNKVPRCNRKLIGMRYFSKGFEATGGSLNDSTLTPVDQEGHGTHTLSTAGGRFVANVSIAGFAGGIIKGGSPLARVAAYKVCWPGILSGGCTDADVLAGFDHAIHDGVDVISVSLGGEPEDYLKDGVALGAYHAVKNGISVICSAGNSGPNLRTVTNSAPWILTVAASTIDRFFPSVVKLGNRKHYTGQSVSQRHMPQMYHPLIDAASAPAKNSSTHSASLCFLDALNPEKVRGKVVVCLRGVNNRVEKGQAVLMAGGTGMILANDETTGNEIISDAHVLPATHISYTDGLAVFSYINSTKHPVAYITPPSTYLGARPAPVMAAFSSRGPSVVDPQILKPDITAPGVNIIASYSPAAPDAAGSLFAMESGTSMSCPHVTGVVGLLRTKYPHWSPSAVRSAIMTTARTRDNLESPIKSSVLEKATPFSYGAGHLRPNRAMNPGLVYDLTNEDYLLFLCSRGYNSTQMAVFSPGFKCPAKKPSPVDFNYPSITVHGLTSAITVKRRLKNVGTPGTYRARVVPPVGLSITVEPQSLTFEKVGDEKSYRLKMTPVAHKMEYGYAFGRLIWSDGVHYVRSPISVLSFPPRGIKRGG